MLLLPNGNRYVGQFADDLRSGAGVFYWRDDTVYRGQFAKNKMHGWGVKHQPDGPLEVQRWADGDLVFSQVIFSSQRCQLEHAQTSWMFDAQSCVNGLAHGRGMAVSIDGNLIIPEGHFVLGKVIEGDVLTLPVEEQSLRDTLGAQGGN